MSESTQPVEIAITLKPGYGLLINKEESDQIYSSLAKIETRLNELAVEDSIKGKQD